MKSFKKRSFCVVLLALSFGSLLFGMDDQVPGADQIEEGGPTEWILRQLADNHYMSSAPDIRGMPRQFFYMGNNAKVRVVLNEDGTISLFADGKSLRMLFKRRKDKHTTCTVNFWGEYSCDTKGLPLEQYKKAVFGQN